MSAVEQLYTEIEAPWTTEIALPFPPSVNRYMNGLGNKSPQMRAWGKNADAHYVLCRNALTKIQGRYEVEFTFNQMQRGISDLDNRIKPLMDWLQRVQLIQNDKHCEKLTAAWGVAPIGCRVRLRAWKSSLDAPTDTSGEGEMLNWGARSISSPVRKARGRSADRGTNL